MQDEVTQTQEANPQEIREEAREIREETQDIREVAHEAREVAQESREVAREVRDVAREAREIAQTIKVTQRTAGDNAALIISLLAIVTIMCYALSKGVDGVGLATSVGVIGAIMGLKGKTLFDQVWGGKGK